MVVIVNSEFSFLTLDSTPDRVKFSVDFSKAQPFADDDAARARIKELDLKHCRVSFVPNTGPEKEVEKPSVLVVEDSAPAPVATAEAKPVRKKKPAAKKTAKKKKEK